MRLKKHPRDQFLKSVLTKTQNSVPPTPQALESTLHIFFISKMTPQTSVNRWKDMKLGANHSCQRQNVSAAIISERWKSDTCSQEHTPRMCFDTHFHSPLVPVCSGCYHSPIVPGPMCYWYLTWGGDSSVVRVPDS